MMKEEVYELAEDIIERFMVELHEVNLQRGDANDRINAACTAIHTALKIINVQGRDFHR